MKFGLEQHIIDKLITVFEQHSKVDKAVVFGSRAKGNYRPDSDIDIAIKGQDLNTDDIIAMSVAFEEKGITHKIDLINYHSIKEPELKAHIDRVGIEFYSRWKEYKLNEIVTEFIDYRGFTPIKTITGVPLITARIIKGGRLLPVTEYIDINSYKARMTRGFPKKNDILVTTEAPLGEVALIDDENVALGQRIITLRTNSSLCNSIFLKYYFQSPKGQNSLQSLAQGTTVEGMKSADFKVMRVDIPDIISQNIIAEILYSIDEKINLLDKQNKTLEQLAETLFRSYFPMTNEENKYVELGNFVECINGVSYKSSELNPSKVGMVSLKSFDRKGGFSIEGFKEFTGKYKEKQVVVEGDLIVAHTDITQDAEVIGNPALVISNPNFDTMIISMDIVKVVSKVNWISIEFLYFLMKTREFKSHCEGCANGSTVLHLNKQAIPTFEFPEPDKLKVADFTKQSKEIVNKIFLNHRQLRNLVRTRDTLLPKLMSGEVRVNI